MVAEETDSKEETPKKKGSPLKMILFIGVPVLLLIVVAVVLFFTSFGRKLVGLEHEEKKTEEVKVEVKSEFIEMPDLLVNLNTDKGKSRFLKLSLTLEVNDPKTADKLKEIKPRIIDEFQMYLRELRVEDLKGAEGVHRLREQLVLRVNKELEPLSVKDVLFKDLLIQ